MAIRNTFNVDVYYFNSTNNAFVRKETRSIPLPAEWVPCAPGPDRMMRVYSKILFGVGFQQEAYVGQTCAQLDTLANA
jgi:hypothetical protein